MNKKEFGSYLKNVRLSANKTVSDVSGYMISLGYKASEDTIYSWERGNSQPPPDALIDLCLFCGVTNIPAAFGYPVNNPLFSEAEAHSRLLPCDLNDTVYVVHRFLTCPPVIEPVVYKKLLAVIDYLPFGHNEAYLTEKEANAAIEKETTEP